MRATIAHLLGMLAIAPVRGLRIALLQYRIWEQEAWVRDCERDGLSDSLHLDECRGQVAEWRVQIALLEAAQ